MKHTLAIMTLVLVTSQCYASQVVFQKLEDMISSVNVIAVATVQKAEKVSSTNSVHYRYTIEVTNVIAGEMTTKRLTVNFWPQGSPVSSVIVPASGIEDSLKEGQRYVLLFESVREEGSLGVVLTRAEPEQRRAAVLKAWRERKGNDKKGANLRA